MLAKKKEVIKENPVLVFDESDEVSKLKENLNNSETKEFIKKITKNNHSSHMKNYTNNVNEERKHTKHLEELYEDLKLLEAMPLSKRRKETNQDKKDTIFRHTIQTFSDNIGDVNDEDNYNILVEILQPYTNYDIDTCKFVINKFLKDVKKNSYSRRAKKYVLKTLIHFFSTLLKNK